MRKTVELLKSQLVGMEDNVNENLIATVKVGYNHQPTPLEHLSLVHQKDRRVSVTPFDPTMVGAIEEELKKQGFNAYKFSKTTVVVNIPLACGDNHKKVASQMKKLAEEAKVAVRNIRKKFRRKDKGHDRELQVVTDAAIQEICDLVG